MDSIISKEPYCIICGNPNYERHHIYGGVANRPKSEKYGFVVNLCRKHHAEIHRNTHGKISEALRQECQRYYEKNIGTREDFIKEFGKSRL